MKFSGFGLESLRRNCALAASIVTAAGTFAFAQVETAPMLTTEAEQGEEAPALANDIDLNIKPIVAQKADAERETERVSMHEMMEPVARMRAQQEKTPAVEKKVVVAATSVPSKEPEAQATATVTTTVTATPVSKVEAVAAQPGPVAAQEAAAGKTEAYVPPTTRAEQIRRERVRAEIKNEDLVQEKLESVRLNDENKRTQKIHSSPLLNDDSATPASIPASVPASAAPKAEASPSPSPVAVVVPVTVVPVATQDQVKKTQAAPAREGIAPTAEQDDEVDADAESVETTFRSDGGKAKSIKRSSLRVRNSESREHVGSTSAVLNEERVDSSDDAHFYLVPRAGIAGMSGDGSFDVNPRFAVGVGAGFDVTDHFAIEAGYTYQENGVSPGASNPYVVQFYGYNQNYETYALKQHVIDLGGKLYLTDRASRVRPFVGGGGAYSKGYLSYDSAILARLNQWYPNQFSQDYEQSSFAGFLSAGLDVKVSRAISIGFVGKYYSVLSSSENQPLNSAAFGGYQPVKMDYQRQWLSSSLARSSFYSLMAGATFTF